MCFNQPMSGALALVGFLVGCWAWQQTRNKSLVAGIWYFVAMETLQFFQFFWLDDCSSPMNQFLTVIGFLHICFQPYFTHTFSGAFVQSPAKLAQYRVIKNLCLVMGCMMFSRWILFSAPDHTLKCANTEWIRGDRACTVRGNYHLAWELPLHAPTYFMPSNNIHFFMMFAPYIALGFDMWIHGFILFATGPLLSSFITPNLYEQASIWCFFSIGQVCLATFTLYWTLRKTKRGNLWKYNPGKVVDATATNGKQPESLKADNKDL